MIDKIKIDFLIIDFFNTDYRLDWFFSHDRFAKFSKIDITTMNIISNIYHGNQKYKDFSHPEVRANNNANFVRMCKTYLLIKSLIFFIWKINV